MLVASQVAAGKPEILHCSDLPDDHRLRLHGSGTHTPIEQLTVNESTCIEFEFQIGELPVTAAGELLIVWRWPFDWGDLQADDAATDGFMRVQYLPSFERDSSTVELKPKYNWIAGIEPWHHQIRICVEQGDLLEGDKVRLICGDTSGGGKGWSAPTCVADRCRFLILADHQGNGQRIRLVQQPSFRIVPDEPARLAIVAPSDAVVNEPLNLVVRAEDRWGNPTELATVPALSVDGDNAKVDVEFVDTESIRPAYHFALTFSSAGTHCVTAKAGDCAAESSPISVRDEHPELRLFWGDLHSGQSEIGCGCGSLAEHYAFGRDCAGLEFITHQANDHYVTVDEWNETRQVTEQFNEPGRYVTFLGCEWSPLTKDGGDRNVFYRDDEPVLRRSDRFFRESEPDPQPNIPTAPEFHDAFRDLDVLVNIHVGGRMTNLEWYEQKIEKLCETHSTHGTVEWFFMDALSRGYRVGATAGTDGVMGRPGACHPGRRLIRNLRNGLTAVYAHELTRESIWEALQNRRCYATTGERIRLWFEVNGHPMGSETQAEGAIQIKLQIHGTQAIERVDLFRGIEILQSWTVAPPIRDEHESFVRVLWGGTERKGTARLQRVNWNGSLSAKRGELELIETVNFQSCDDEASSDVPNQIQWTSQTAGNAAGIMVRVTCDDATRLHFESGPKKIELELREVCQRELSFDAGGLNRFVRLGPPPDKNGPREFEMTTTDTELLTGCIPYWIRVVQVDQSMAWGSPVYVTRNE